MCKVFYIAEDVFSFATHIELRGSEIKPGAGLNKAPASHTNRLRPLNIVFVLVGIDRV